MDGVPAHHVCACLRGSFAHLHGITSHGVIAHGNQAVRVVHMLQTLSYSVNDYIYVQMERQLMQAMVMAVQLQWKADAHIVQRHEYHLVLCNSCPAGTPTS